MRKDDYRARQSSVGTLREIRIGHHGIFRGMGLHLVGNRKSWRQRFWKINAIWASRDGWGRKKQNGGGEEQDILGDQHGSLMSPNHTSGERLGAVSPARWMHQVGVCVPRNPVKTWSGRVTGTSTRSLLDLHGPFPTSSSAPVQLFLCVTQPTSSPSLSLSLVPSPHFLSSPSCQKQLRSHHIWKHAETPQPELIITCPVPTVIVSLPHCSTYCILSAVFPSPCPASDIGASYPISLCRVSWVQGTVCLLNEWIRDPS